MPVHAPKIVHVSVYYSKPGDKWQVTSCIYNYVDNY